MYRQTLIKVYKKKSITKCFQKKKKEKKKTKINEKINIGALKIKKATHSEKVKENK